MATVLTVVTMVPEVSFEHTFIGMTRFLGIPHRATLQFKLGFDCSSVININTHLY
jgi:hypothetical protein